MTASTISSFEASLRSALELQCEWGVEDVTEPVPWMPMAVPAALPVSKEEVIVRPSHDRQVTQQVRQKNNPLKPEIPVITSVSERQPADLASLARFIHQFKEMPLARTATHDLMPEFHETARFVLIGEVPDADEDRSGRLFSGEAGFYLEKILHSLNLKREDVSFIPSIPWRPPGGRPLSFHELKVAARIVHYALLLVKTLPVITMGTTPLRLLEGKATQILKARGKWHEFTLAGKEGKIRFLPTYHPLQLKAGSVVRRGLWRDMLLLSDTININEK